MSHKPTSADSTPLVSIVVPALNEELTIGEFVDWCREGLSKAGVSGQILIVDSSSDHTGEIAEQHGAEALRVPKRGLGRAYIDALPHIQGQYVIMGDCDLTYDFRELGPFIEKLNQGADFVMGSRFTGYIQPGAMPPLHQYFGTPVTTAILNLMYGTRFTDIHCGMRAMTLDALLRINLESQSWEYASEMVLKAARLQLRTAEVPIRFYASPAGRLTHHQRAGWFSAWWAGWINLKAMFLYGPDFFLMKPGWAMFIIGLLLTLSLVGGPYTLAGVGLNLHWMLLGVTLSTLGYSAIQLGILAQVYFDFDPAHTERVCNLISYDRGVLTAMGLVAVGVVLNLVLVLIWLRSGLKLADYYHTGVLGLLLIILGFQTFTFTLILNMIGRKR